MGQRLILLGGTMLTLALTAVPGILAGGAVALALYRFIGPPAFVAAAVAFAAVIGLEVLFASEILGGAYDRLDLLSVERAE